jgi:excisionase family DNA binding protein
VSEIQVLEERQKFFTTKSLANVLSVSERQVRNWIREGKLRSYKLDGSRRIDPADVDSFLAERIDSGRSAA